MNTAENLSRPMQNLLAGFPAWPGANHARLRSMGTGLNSQVLRVRFAHEDLVVRQSLPADAAVKLSPARELAALAAAARVGIAPHLRAVDPDSGVSVSEYVPGARPWTDGDLLVPENLQRLVQILKTLHGLAHVLPAFDPESVAGIYIGKAPGFASHYRDELLSLTSSFAKQFNGHVFCHNDLMAANILDSGRLWLIDFEYAVLSDPILDLAGVAALNGLASDRRGHLLRAYYGTGSPSMAVFNRVCRMVLLLALAWVAASGGATPGALWLDLQQTLLTRLRLFEG